MNRFFIILLALGLSVSACKSKQKTTGRQPKKNRAIRFTEIEKPEVDEIYRRFRNAVNPMHKNIRSLQAKGTFHTGKLKLPAEFTVNRNRMWKIALYFGGRKTFPVRYENDKLTLWNGDMYVPGNEEKKEFFRRLSQYPVEGIFGYFYHHSGKFLRVDVNKINGIPVNGLAIRDKNYDWLFYFDKKSGFPVRWEKRNKNGILFAIEFMDFRNTNGLLLSYHMIGYNNKNKKTSYIWKKYNIQ